LWNYFVIIVPGDRASGTTLRLSCQETDLVELLYDYRAIRRGLWNYFVIIVPGDAGLMALFCDYRAGRLGLWNQFTIIVPGDGACATNLRLLCLEIGILDYTLV